MNEIPVIDTRNKGITKKKRQTKITGNIKVELG